MSEPAAYRLLEDDGEAPQSFLITGGRHRLGSARSNDVVLSRPAVSRHHALLVVGDEEVTIEDLASKNGTWVNGEEVSTARLCVGDEIRLGEARLRLETAPAGSATLANISCASSLPVRAAAREA